MAEKLIFYRSCLFVVWISLMIILSPQKSTSKVNNKARKVYILSGLDIKHFPSRDSGLPRKYDQESHVSPSLKRITAILVTSMSMSAGFLVFLAGDISLSPGPIKNSAIVCPGCSKVIETKSASFVLRAMLNVL